MSKNASVPTVLAEPPQNGFLFSGLHQANQWLPTLIPGTWTTLGAYLVGYASVIPGAAETVLRRHNGQNRKLDRRDVSRYARDLLQGKWMLNGETILFDDSGLLRQGQHRLNACVKSGIPLPTFIIAGVPSSVFASLDQHRKRRPSEVLGGQGVKSYTAVASGAAALHKFFASGRVVRQHGTSHGLSMWEITDVFRTNPGLEESGVFARELGRTSNLFRGPAHVTALHYLFSQVNKDLASEFFTRLRNSSIPDAPGWAALRLLASRLQDNRGTLKGLPDADLTALVIKAWNALVVGKPISQLKLGQNEPYPHIAGLAYSGDVPVVPLEVVPVE